MSREMRGFTGRLLKADLDWTMRAMRSANTTDTPGPAPLERPPVQTLPQELAERWRPRGMVSERRREALAWGVSLGVHLLLLGLTFGGQGLGLPGFGLPWQERRAEVPELRVRLTPGFGSTKSLASPMS